MNPLIETIGRDLTRDAASSALPWAPVVSPAPARLGVTRRRAGAALRSLAHRVEPRDAVRVENAAHAA